MSAAFAGRMVGSSHMRTYACQATYKTGTLVEGVWYAKALQIGMGALVHVRQPEGLEHVQSYRSSL